ncbi:FHA domain-containing protein [Iodobacter arcticus]|uniref:FHA domain-containing protein n=1 Tax=Iodobacter arcticus TaxID=590593 RepID=A0ABW2QVR5_9NEIS
MAQLRNENELLYLRTLHIFGRNPSKVDTVLGNSDASQIHTVIAWNGVCWDITDHSRNGTFIDGKRLQGNVKTALAIGQKLQFGLGGNVSWQVMDLEPPCPMLLPLDKTQTAIVLQNFHFLPDETHAQASVYLSANGQWVWDDETGCHALKDGDVVRISDQAWRYSFSAAIELTADVRLNPAIQHVHPIHFDFLVSQNEEHVYLSIDFSGAQINLGERTHHYSLLTLARRRYEDAQRGMDALSQGWIAVDDLSKMLGLEPTHLNTQLFRARSQVMRECHENKHCPEVIERRRGEVRFSAAPFRIMRGMQLEAHFNPHIAPSPLA